MFDIRTTIHGRAIATVLSATLATTHLLACGGGPTADSSSIGSPDDSAPATTHAYDGETVLRGVLFGRGPVATLLPDMWGDGIPVGELSGATDPHALADQLERSIATWCADGCSDTTRTGLQQAADRLRAGEKDRLVTPDPLTLFTRSQGPKADATVNAIIASIRSGDPAFLERFGEDMQSGNPVRVRQAFEDAGHRLVASAVALHHDTAGDLGASADISVTPGEGDGDGSGLYIYIAAVAVVLIAIFVGPVVALKPMGAQRAGDSLTYDRLIATITAQLQRS